MQFLLNILAVVIGLLLSNYIHGFVFAKFKADKYEDVLAQKIAKQVAEALSQSAQKETKE